MGVNALKEHTIPLEDIEACLHELDEAISDHREVAGALGMLFILCNYSFIGYLIVIC